MQQPVQPERMTAQHTFIHRYGQEGYSRLTESQTYSEVMLAVEAEDWDTVELMLSELHILPEYFWNMWNS